MSSRSPASQLPRRPAAPLPTDILLVQGSPLEAELLLRPLQELEPSAHIEVARDGEEALDFLLGRGAFRHRLGAAPPRLVLLDLKLSRLDGIEVLRGLRGNSRTLMTPVVVLASSIDPRQLAECYQLGANSCVQKPVRYDEFWDTIQALGRYWLGFNESPPSAASPVS
ncbi:MAG: response regulator [Gemmatimonadales bacterium]